MRVLQINACHYPRGGSETVYFSTARLLKSYGHTVAFFSTKDPRNDKSEFDNYFVHNGDIRKLSLLKKSKRSLSYLYNNKVSKNLKILVRDFNPDIAHVHLFYAELSVSVLRTLKKLNIPVIHTVHDYRLLCPVKNLLDRKGNVCELCLDKHFLHCLKKRCSEGNTSQSLMVTLEAYFWKYFVNPLDYIDHFIFVSRFSRNKHIGSNENFKNKSSEIYNFTSFNPQNDLFTRGDYFLYFGRLSFEKGIESLLSVFSVKTSFKLKIAGTGPLSDQVEKHANENSNIEYVGFKKGEELYSLVKNSLFVIVPSVWYENNPMTIIESLSLGKPVIGSHIGGIPELIVDGENGYLFKPADIQSLTNTVDRAGNISDLEYKRFSDNSKKIAREYFNSDKHYKELLTVYQNVLKIYSKKNL
jgi:glycosyltransferase involved in cell wall biosynthesis